MSLADWGNSFYEVADSVTSLLVDIPSSTYRICITKPGFIPFIVDVHNQQYIQNERFEGNHIFIADETHIGYDVMPNQNMGPVSIQNGHFQIINRGGVIIKNGFEVKKGAEFKIK